MPDRWPWQLGPVSRTWPFWGGRLPPPGRPRSLSRRDESGTAAKVRYRRASLRHLSLLCFWSIPGRSWISEHGFPRPHSGEPPRSAGGPTARSGPRCGGARLGSSVGATLATAPITAAALGAVAVIGIALNFLAIPIAAVAIPGVLASLLIFPLWPGWPLRSPAERVWRFICSSSWRRPVPRCPVVTSSRPRRSGPRCHGWLDLDREPLGHRHAKHPGRGTAAMELGGRRRTMGRPILGLVARFR